MAMAPETHLVDFMLEQASCQQLQALALETGLVRSFVSCCTHARRRHDQWLPVPQGQSALHWAARRGHVDLARVLVRYGARLDDRRTGVRVVTAGVPRPVLTSAITGLYRQIAVQLAAVLCDTKWQGRVCGGFVATGR